MGDREHRRKRLTPEQKWQVFLEGMRMEDSKPTQQRRGFPTLSATHPKHSRRSFLIRLGTAFGAAAVVGVPGRAQATLGDRALNDPGLSVRLAVVERDNDRTVIARIESSDELVDLPARDFPVAWEFQVGDRVAVVDAPDEEDTPVIIPFLVTTERAQPKLVRDDTVAFGKVEGELTNESVRAQIQRAIRNPRPEGYPGVFVENPRTGKLTAFGVIEQDSQ